MHQIHLQNFVWDSYKHAAIRGCLEIYYTSPREASIYRRSLPRFCTSRFCTRDFQEDYEIDVRDPGLKGWNPCRIDANMLASFIPSCVRFIRSVSATTLALRKENNVSTSFS